MGLISISMASHVPMSRWDGGNCYIRAGNGCYASADWEQELTLLEDFLKCLGATLKTPYNETFIRERGQELQTKDMPLLTLEVEPEDFTIH